jgi:hypothetical protein
MSVGSFRGRKIPLATNAPDSTKALPTILPEGRGCIGLLESVELEDGAAIVQIDGRRYEAPGSILEALMGLVGQDTIIACIAGQVRAGRCSA